MSLQPVPVPPVPAETARAARAAFPKGNRYLLMRDTFGPLFEDVRFAPLFSFCGSPALAPWRLALVCLLQFAEGLSDRQAADAVRRCLDWKYLLSLELTDPGFDASVLTEFRQRLVAGNAEELLFTVLLEQFDRAGLFQRRGRQRTDATHVRGALRTLQRLELVGETLRHALNVLAVAYPDWVRSVALPDWVDRYGEPIWEQRLPAGEAAREAWAVQVGEDGWTLLTTLDQDPVPEGLPALPAVRTLQQVWAQQYLMEDGRVRFRRPDELPAPAQQIRSPHDPDARCGQKRQTAWTGYKVHLTEQCEPELPLLITDVATTAGSVGDSTTLPEIQARLAARDRLPDSWLVDASYTEATLLVRTPEVYGSELLGPVEADTSWQARAQQGFAAADFHLDWEQQQATCPAGQKSVGWRECTDRGHRAIEVRFAPAGCRACPLRGDCTRSAAGRRLTLRPRAEHEALQAARARAETAAFREAYAPRAGIEGTLSQAIRRCDARQARYRGLPKVRLQQWLTGAALNFVRVAAWLLEVPRARTRVAAFARVMVAA